MHTKDFILISPYSRALRNRARNPKNYPWFQEVIDLLHKEVIQIGTMDEKPLENTDFLVGLPLDAITDLVSRCSTWISVDNFLPHLIHLNPKPGVVIFGRSDPKIFGHDENINLLRGREYLRPLQFDIWEKIDYSEEVFVKPEVVVEAVRSIIDS